VNVPALLLQMRITVNRAWKNSRFHQTGKVIGYRKPKDGQHRDRLSEDWWGSLAYYPAVNPAARRHEVIGESDRMTLRFVKR